MKSEGIRQDLNRMNKLLYIVIVILILNIVITILVNGKVEETPLYNESFDISSFTTIKLNEIEEYVNTEEYKILVIGKPNCQYTAKMIPLLEQAQEEFGYETLYVDLREISEDDQESLFEYDDSTDFIKEYLGTTPFIIVFKDNKMVDTWVGYENYSKFIHFLTSLGLEKKEN